MFYSKTCVLLMIVMYKSRANRTSALQKKGGTKLEGFIVGGDYAKIVDFPHSAFLAVSCLTQTVEDFACGASIINQMMLLTAAHCFEGCRAGSKVSVLVGNAYRDHRLFRQIGSFANHAKYDGEKLKNDIAVAMLTQPLVFSNTVKRVILSQNGIYNEPAMMAGWGVTDETYDTDSLYLKFANQRVWQRKKCLTVLKHMNVGSFCASGDQNKSFGYASVGDSGSALIVRGSIQIGLVSHKLSKTSKSLVVYTDVPQYYDWITRTTKSLYCQT